MAQPLQNINIAAPAFAGINTEDSPLQTGDVFGEIADNCVIDRYGRIGARRGFADVTTDKTAYASNAVEQIAEHVPFVGSTPAMFSFANNKVFQGEAVPADITPAGHAGITGNDWDHGQVAKWSMFAQDGHEMLFYDEAADTMYEHSHATISGGLTTFPQGNVCVGAYGRCWTYERSSVDNKGYLYFSDLLIPYDFNGGSSGSFILDNVWPNGNDDVIGMAAHNGFMILFGRRQILVYGGMDDLPGTNGSLVDTVSGIGCIQRDSVVSTGDDIIWLDSEGVRSFGRTIQEKSLPIGDISANVRSDIRQAIVDSEAVGNKYGAAAYSQATGFYMITFPDLGYIYVFSMSRGPLENGAYRTTRWTGLQTVKAITFTSDDRTLVGTDTSSIAHYTEYSDWGEEYTMRYYSNPLDFDQPSTWKIPKQVDVTIIGGAGMTFRLLWAFDFLTNYRKRLFEIGGSSVGQYNISEYNLGAEYTEGVAIRTQHINVGGKGRYMSVALEGDVTGPISIQELNIQTLIGRIR